MAMSHLDPTRRNHLSTMLLTGKQNNILPSANAQQIRAATTPAKAMSPLSKVKTDCIALKASLEASVVKRRQLQLTGEHNKIKITHLKNINNQLMQDTLRECRMFNKLIDEAMSEARKLSSEALEIMREANLKAMKVDNQIISECSRLSANI